MPCLEVAGQIRKPSSARRAGHDTAFARRLDSAAARSAVVRRTRRIP
jgi:hypothetical protein